MLRFGLAVVYKSEKDTVKEFIMGEKNVRQKIQKPGAKNITLWRYSPWNLT